MSRKNSILSLQEQPPGSGGGGESATATCAHLVEQKLTEIAKQAEELAKTIRRAAEIEDEESEEAVSFINYFFLTLYPRYQIEDKNGF